MSDIIYLDNSATTAALPEVADAVADMLLNNYGNPSSVHGLGVRAEQELRRARQRIASLLGVGEQYIYFTSGGTESNNWAVKSLAHVRRKYGQHIITSAIEHASVLESCKQLAQEGFRITYLPVDQQGIISLDALEEALSDDTVLVSLMSVNNEVGSLQPLQEAAALLKKKHSQALLHIDHVQGFSKIPLDIRRLGAAAVSVSSHKIHGPKGCGALYLNTTLRLPALISGGDQEKGKRGGTENISGIAGFGTAAEIAAEAQSEHVGHMYLLKEQFEKELSAAVPDAVFNSPPGREGAPQIVNVSFPGIKSEVLVHMLEMHNVYVSSGSACHAQRNSDSHVLKAMHLGDARIKSAVRISFCPYNTPEEITKAVSAFRSCVGQFRRL